MNHPTTADKGEQECREAFERDFDAVLEIIREDVQRFISRRCYRRLKEHFARHLSSKQADQFRDATQMVKADAVKMPEPDINTANHAGVRVVGFYESTVKAYATAHTAEAVRELVEGLGKAISQAEMRICTHDETHRGGAIWEICDQCGAKWADDEGGKPEFMWPKAIVELNALLAKYAPSQEEKE